MDFWTSRKAQDDKNDDREREPKPTFLQNLTEFVKDEAKDEAISSAVEFLTDGWITYDGGDDEDEEPQRKKKPEDGTFEERLQRSLAELQQQAAAHAAPAAPVIASPPPVDVPVAPIQPPMPRQAVRPSMRGPGGFGRKGL